MANAATPRRMIHAVLKITAAIAKFSPFNGRAVLRECKTTTKDRTERISANARGSVVFRNSEITSPSLIGARRASVPVNMGRRIATGNARIETMTATTAKTLVRWWTLE